MTEPAVPHPGYALRTLHAAVQTIVDSLANEAGAKGTPRVELTRPAEEKFGDFATNVALLLAPLVGSNPREVGASIADAITQLEGVERADVAGPGFVNLVLDDSWFHDVHQAVREAGDSYGSATTEVTDRVVLEFVSANPTGPLNAASARHAALGDSLARLMRFCGYDVSTEYYVNDFGRQVKLFGESILARATGGEVPEGGYEGDYVVDLARELGASPGDSAEELGSRGVAAMVDHARATLEQFRVHFDHFQSELALHTSDRVAQAIEKVAQMGQTFEKDGALWLRTTAFGDDKDRVVVRADGTPTYFASDLGYLLDKLERGFDRPIYVLGADHHGYIARLRAAMSCLGHEPENLEIVIVQMVSLLQGGEQRRMSKRRGDFVTMDEFIELVGVDAGRFFMLQRSHDQALDLDLDLAGEQSNKNPVYYVQYAHARICSIMRKAADEGATPDDAGADSIRQIPLHASERRLVKRLAEFPVVALDAAQRRQPHRIGFYAHDLASDFSQFYRDCRVIGEGVTPEQTALRLQLAASSRTVIARCLDLLGVSAPETM